MRRPGGFATIHGMERQQPTSSTISTTQAVVVLFALLVGWLVTGHAFDVYHVTAGPSLVGLVVFIPFKFVAVLALAGLLAIVPLGVFRDGILAGLGGFSRPAGGLYVAVRAAFVLLPAGALGNNFRPPRFLN